MRHNPDTSDGYYSYSDYYSGYPSGYSYSYPYSYDPYSYSYSYSEDYSYEDESHKNNNNTKHKANKRNNKEENRKRDKKEAKNSHKKSKRYDPPPPTVSGTQKSKNRDKTKDTKEADPGPSMPQGYLQQDLTLATQQSITTAAAIAATISALQNTGNNNPVLAMGQAPQPNPYMQQFQPFQQMQQQIPQMPQLQQPEPGDLAPPQYVPQGQQLNPQRTPDLFEQRQGGFSMPPPEALERDDGPSMPPARIPEPRDELVQQQQQQQPSQPGTPNQQLLQRLVDLEAQLSDKEGEIARLKNARPTTGGGVSEEEYAACRNKAASLEAQLKVLEQRLETTTSNIQLKDSELELAKREVNRLSSDVEQLRQRLKDEQEQNKKRFDNAVKLQEQETLKAQRELAKCKTDLEKAMKEAEKFRNICECQKDEIIQLKDVLKRTGDGTNSTGSRANTTNNRGESNIPSRNNSFPGFDDPIPRNYDNNGNNVMRNRNSGGPVENVQPPFVPPLPPPVRAGPPTDSVSSLMKDPVDSVKRQQPQNITANVSGRNENYFSPNQPPQIQQEQQQQQQRYPTQNIPQQQNFSVPPTIQQPPRETPLYPSGIPQQNQPQYLPSLPPQGMLPPPQQQQQPPMLIPQQYQQPQSQPQYVPLPSQMQQTQRPYSASYNPMMNQPQTSLPPGRPSMPPFSNRKSEIDARIAEIQRAMAVLNDGEKGISVEMTQEEQNAIERAENIARQMKGSGPSNIQDRMDNFSVRNNDDMYQNGPSRIGPVSVPPPSVAEEQQKNQRQHDTQAAIFGRPEDPHKAAQIKVLERDLSAATAELAARDEELRRLEDQPAKRGQDILRKKFVQQKVDDLRAKVNDIKLRLRRLDALSK